jgi:hypothetical protein
MSNRKKPEEIDILEGKIRRVEVRMSERELRTIDRSAAKIGITRSEYLRLRGTKQVYTKALPERDYTTLSRNYRELRAQGNNLNQIARALNTAQLAGDRVNLDVRDVEAAIASISLTTQIIRTAMR